MAKRQREWANRARSAIVEALGSCCWACLAEDSYRREFGLEIDHIDPATKGHNSRKVEFSHRISIYRRQLKQGLLQLLCKEHNCSKYTRKIAYPAPPGVVLWKDGAECPF